MRKLNIFVFSDILKAEKKKKEKKKIMQKIISNKIKCKYCGDVIESRSRHDFKFCSCKKVAVDGGKDYLRRLFTVSPADFEDLSEVVETEENPSEEKETDDSDSHDPDCFR